MCENGKIYLNLSIFTVILKKRIIFSKIRRSKLQTMQLYKITVFVVKAMVAHVLNNFNVVFLLYCEGQESIVTPTLNWFNLFFSINIAIL